MPFVNLIIIRGGLQMIRTRKRIQDKERNEGQGATGIYRDLPRNSKYRESS